MRGKIHGMKFINKPPQNAKMKFDSILEENWQTDIYEKYLFQLPVKKKLFSVFLFFGFESIICCKNVF